jgi:hypothetical protein
MPTNAPPTLDFRDVFFVSPEIVLTVWGLLVLLVDLGLERRLSAAMRRRAIGWLSLAGVGVAFVAAVVVCFVPLYVRAWPLDAESGSAGRPSPTYSDRIRSCSYGTLAGDGQSVLQSPLRPPAGPCPVLSMAWSFTEEWGSILP